MSVLPQGSKKRYAVSSYFVKGNNYTNHLRIVSATSEAEAIGLFLRDDGVRKTVTDGSVMIGNPPACVEVPEQDMSDPARNPFLSDEEKAILRCAIRWSVPYRSYVDAIPGSEKYKYCLRLVNKGFLVRYNCIEGNKKFFFITQAGRKELER